MLNDNVISFANHALKPVTLTGHAPAPIFPALNSTGFDTCIYPIQTQPAYTPATGETQESILISGNLGNAVVRTDTMAPLGIVGDSYTVAPNNKLRDVVAEACERVMPANYMRNITLKEETSSGGAFTKFTYTFPEAAQPIRQLIGASGFSGSGNWNARSRETILNFNISVINSFNGRTAVILKAGATDLVCLNGMVLEEYDTSKKRHSAGFNPASLAPFIERQAVQYSQRVRIWQEWANATITAEQAGEALKAANISDRLTAKFMERLEIEAASRGRTIWSLYSALTYYSSHNSDDFAVRNSQNVDNVAESLNKREGEVSRIISSSGWRDLVASAA